MDHVVSGPSVNSENRSNTPHVADQGSQVQQILTKIFHRNLASALWRTSSLMAGAVCCFLASNATAQIGGKTAADGPFVLDNVEDLDLTAGGVGRDWVPSFVNSQSVLSVQSLAGSGLTLLPGQSPIGALRAQIPASFGSINSGFGVPTPAQVGASTLTSPGDITSFTSLTFDECYQTGITNAQFEILLECYPQNGDTTYPTLVWNYSPAKGTSFQPVTVTLRNPSTIVNNPSGKTVEELLGKARFLFFYFFASPVSPSAQVDAHIDDIELTAQPMTAVEEWEVFE